MKQVMKKGLVIIIGLVLLLSLFSSVMNAAPNPNPTWYVDARVHFSPPMSVRTIIMRLKTRLSFTRAVNTTCFTPARIKAAGGRCFIRPRAQFPD